MTQYCASVIRQHLSSEWLGRLTKPVWIVNGRKCHTAVAAIVPYAIYRKLQEKYGLELEKL